MIRSASEKDFQDLLDVWESAVKATHDFLSEKDFNFYKSKIKSVYFCEVSLYVYESKNGIIQGFIGTYGDSLEMLFVHDSYRGKGIGKQLLYYAVNELGIRKVSVNKQNTKALLFYKKYNFIEQSYSDTDSEGKPYPIINMILNI